MGFLVFVIVVLLVIGLVFWVGHVPKTEPKVHPLDDPTIDWSKTACKGGTTNRCVAEGCFGMSCIK